jgi:hypothetical protein
MIYPDAKACAILTAKADKPHQATPLFLFTTGVVARVDTYFFHVCSGHLGHLGIEVYIGNEWCSISGGSKGLFDDTEVLPFPFIPHGEADKLRTGFYHPDSLGYGGFRLHG